MHTSHSRVKAHFKKNDPVIYPIVKNLDFDEWYKPSKNHDDYFRHLYGEIISQQLGGKAADTIISRFEKLFPRGNVTAEKLLKIPDNKLREAGMSWSKVSFLKDLAQKTVREEIHYSEIHNMGNDEVISELTQVKGIGPWTAEMFLIFALGREDIFSHADLGLRNGMKKVYSLKKTPDLKKAEKITNKWKPYRSYGSFALWQSLE